MSTPAPAAAPAPRSRSVLDWIEAIGNRIPEPPLLFAGLTLLIILLSAVGHGLEWNVKPVKPQIATEQVAGEGGATVARPVLDADGKPVGRRVETGAGLTPRGRGGARGPRRRRLGQGTAPG